MKSSVIIVLICSLLIPFTCFLLWYYAAHVPFLTPSMCDIMNKVSSPAIWSSYWKVLHLSCYSTSLRLYSSVLIYKMVQKWAIGHCQSQRCQYFTR